MKKRVLFFACFCMLFSLGAKAQAPLFDYDVTVQNTGTITSSADAAANYSLVQNGISINGNGLSSTLVGVRQDGTSGINYLNFTTNNNRVNLISNTNDIRRVSVVFRGSGDAGVGTVIVASSADGTTFTDRGTGTTAGVSLANRVLVEVDIPAGQRYIQIRRSGSTLRIYRIAAGDANYTLPLDLLSFSAKPDALGKSVNLNWKTANEVNTQDFLVERRTDDTEFTTVGTVLSKNVAGTHSYSFTDTKPVAGNSYYRLKQRDKDGKSSYSDIANVKIEGISLSLHPNPVSKDLVVSHDYGKQSALLKVIGLDGKTHIKTNSAVGSSSTTINVASLASGTYLLVHDVNGKSQSQKFIKK